VQCSIQHGFVKNSSVLKDGTASAYSTRAEHEFLGYVIEYEIIVFIYIHVLYSKLR
jgi:hypothetical protein